MVERLSSIARTLEVTWELPRIGKTRRVSSGPGPTHLLNPRSGIVNANLKSTLVVGIIPTLIVSLLFYVLLGHRRDYLGHYAAGYGGTLSAIAIVLAAIPGSRFGRLGSSIVLPCTILCIAAGTVMEATVFRLAKFDEIDYCNQNLGAILAGLVAIHIAGNRKPTDAALRCLIGIGAIFLMLGGYFAVT